MEKNKIQFIIFIILIVFGTLLWIYPLLKDKSSTKQEKMDEYKILEVEGSISFESFLDYQKRLESKRSNISWGADPFRIVRSGEEDGSYFGGVVLSGIAADDKGKLAIINEEIVREGDTILDIEILEITENNVKIKRKGKIFILNIYKRVEEESNVNTGRNQESQEIGS